MRSSSCSQATWSHLRLAHQVELHVAASYRQTLCLYQEVTVASVVVGAYRRVELVTNPKRKGSRCPFQHVTRFVEKVWGPMAMLMGPDFSGHESIGWKKNGYRTFGRSHGVSHPTLERLPAEFASECTELDASDHACESFVQALHSCRRERTNA